MKSHVVQKILLCLCINCIFAFAQETVEIVRRQIKSVEQETAREKSLHETEKKRHAEFIEVGRKKVQALSAQNKALLAEIDSLKAEIKNLDESRQKASGTIHWYENRKIKYNEALARVIDSLAPAFEADFPYKNNEVVLALHEISEQLHKGFVSSDDAINRTLEIFYDRIRLGYTTEVYNGFLQVDARNVPGTYLRYGAIACVFVSNDGNDVLWLTKTADGGYTWKNVSENLAMRAALKDVVKVAQGKTAPRLVTIPVFVPKEGN